MKNNIIDLSDSKFFKVKDFTEFIINPDNYNIPRTKENNLIINTNVKHGDNLFKVVGIHHNALAGNEYLGNIGLVTKQL